MVRLAVALALLGLTSGASAQPRAVLIGTGSSPDDTPVFVGAVLRGVRETLGQRAHLPDASIVTLYGDGPSPGREAHVVDDAGRSRRVEVPGVGARASFTPGSLDAALDEVGRTPPAHVLVVIAGHGLPDGAPAWSQPRAYSTDAMERSFGRANAPVVLVDGTCFGGQRAQIASCGFFAARPDTMAEGCDPDAALLRPGAALQDYVTSFFRAATTTGADADGDGRVSLAEAHWHAALHGTRGNNATYTTTDALADELLEGADPSILADVLDRAGLDALARHATPAERRAYGELRLAMGGGMLQSLFVRDADVAFKAGVIEGTFHVAPFAEAHERITFSMARATRARRSLAMPIDALLERGPDGSVVFRRGRQRALGGSVEFRPDPRVVDLWSRDEDSDVPSQRYRPALITLVRRLALRRAVADGRAPAEIETALAAADACESQTLAAVVGARPAP